jgi:hypothetical protein
VPTVRIRWGGTNTTRIGSLLGSNRYQAAKPRLAASSNASRPQPEAAHLLPWWPGTNGRQSRSASRHAEMTPSAQRDSLCFDTSGERAMAIRLKCQQCSSVVRVAEKYAGRKVKCPACQGPIDVPAQVDQAPQSASIPAASAGRSAADQSRIPENAFLLDAPSAAALLGAQSETASQEPPNDQSSSSSVQPPQRLAKRAKLAIVATGVAALCAVVGVAVFLIAKGSFANFWSGPWGSQVRVKDDTLGTTFLVELKDGWYLREANVAGPRRAFAIVYSYKNIGPREGALSISKRINEELAKNAIKEITGQNTAAGPENRIEIKTDKGRIYRGSDFAAHWHSQRPKLDLGEWRPIAADGKIESTGESAFLFVVPADEIPTELLTPSWLALSRKLPQSPFQTRYFSEVFGFLPEEPDKAIPRLIEAMKDRNPSICLAAMHELERLHAWTPEHVPSLTEALLGSRNPLEVRFEAATILGELGPPAKDGLTALHEALRLPSPLFGPGDPTWQRFRTVTQEALEKIGGRNALVAALADSIEKKVNVVDSAKALEALGPEAKQAVPALKEFLRIARHDTRYAQRWISAVTEALEKIVGGDEAASLIAELDHQHATEVHQQQPDLRPKARQSFEKARRRDSMRSAIGPQTAARQEREQTPKGPLSGVWRDKKSGLGLQIEDDGSTLDIQLSGRNSLVRQFTANLSRDGKKADWYEGSAEAKFVHNAFVYSRQITVKVNKLGQLELKCPEWPDPYGRAKPRMQTATLIRQGDLPRSRR